MKKIHDYTPVGLAIALFLACLATAGCAVNGYYVSMGIALLLAAGCVGGIYAYMKRTSRLMKQFVRAVRYSEFPEAFDPKQLNGVSPELLAEMQEALSAYRNDLQKRESRLQYFRALAEHIDTAILVYTPDGALEWMNRSAARLVSSAIDESHSETYVLRAPKTLADLRYLHPELPERLRKLTPGQLDIVQIAHRGEEPTQLALSGMSFVLQGHRLLIASLKNIYSALDTQETESWQKLLRVLTHEIMNSLTPIVSLAELLDTQIAQTESLTEEKADMRQMLQTIARRGKSLTHFVNSYREVTHLPPPQLQLHNAADLLNDVARLMQASVSIRTACPPAPLPYRQASPPEAALTCVAKTTARASSRMCCNTSSCLSSPPSRTARASASRWPVKSCTGITEALTCNLLPAKEAHSLCYSLIRHNRRKTLSLPHELKMDFHHETQKDLVVISHRCCITYRKLCLPALLCPPGTDTPDARH